MSATRKLRKLFTRLRSDGRFKKDVWLVGSRATAGIENDPRMRQLDVAGIVWLDHFPAENSDVEVLRFLVVLTVKKGGAKKPSCAIGASGRLMRCPCCRSIRTRSETPTVSRKRFICRLLHNGPLVQERFPVGWHPSCGSRCGLISGMRVRWKQFHTFDHPLLLVVVEPVLARFKAGNDRMPCCRRMF